jgi:MYXO-CTERM domain-containing protein
VVVECFAPDAGWVQIGGDCEPADAAINPGAVEICNGVDENCSGGEEDAPGAAPWYPDLDGDTFGDDAGVIVDCTPVPDYVADGGDCDDDDANSFPGGVEVCDGIDNDCSGIPDDGYPEVDWWPDLDEDGFGSALRESRRHFCAPYEPYQSWVTNDGDCDDDNNAVHPDADEICNDIDDDCDGLADLDDDDLVDGVLAWDDIDGDGYGSGEPALVCDVDGMALVDGDCDDMAPLVNPDQAEIPDNDVDEDCDGNTPKSPVEEVVDDGCQCSQSSGPPSGLVALLALVLIRRRRDHES